MRTVQLVFLSLLVVSAGCIKVDQKLTIREDGRGSLALDYSISEQSITQIKAMFKLRDQLAELSGETSPPVPVSEESLLFLNPDEKAIGRKMKSYEELGIHVEKLKVRTVNAWRHVEMQARFDDLANLAKADFFSDYGFSLSKDANGNYLLSRPRMEAAGDAASDYLGKNTVELLTPILSGFNVVLSVTTPGIILDTNAPRKSTYSAAWIFDFNRNPNAFLGLQRQDFRIVFSGKDISLPEIRQKTSG